ncbi:MAG TPA: N-acetyltransferase [Acidobacteriaceae bacterium]|nr:N-acetyltransferase [Acidobacteriaceae bacterium]
MTPPDASSLVMRPAVPQDLNALLAIDNLCFPPGIAYPRHEIAILLRAPAVVTIAALLPQGIVGFASMGFKQLRHLAQMQLRAELITIDVLPEFRRLHVGWRLHQALEEQCRIQNGKNIALHVAVENAAAIAFYQGLDYRVVERVPHYYLDSIDAWRMEKSLSDAK